jgi:3-oxoacyl-[acyl-carrier protein] reductase
LKPVLEGKTALVTGCSGTIGRAIAGAIADEGGNVIVHYRTRESEAFEIADEVRAKGTKAMVVRADIAVWSEAESMVNDAVAEFGSVDILVNNAAFHRGGKVHKLPIEDWDMVIKSCLYGTFFCTRCVIPFMIERKWGRIINISSPAGERGHAGETAYGAAKAGLLGFTKSLAKEVAQHGITVNAVIPGFVPNEGTKFLTQKSMDQIKAGILLGRAGEPREVADLILFLIAHGDYITGSIHHVDGGLTV